MGKKVELIRKEMIKPALATPDHLRTVQLSFLDNFFPPIYVAAVFFYDLNNHTIPEDIISQRLKKSLSETLTRFYPLAGRIEGASINCNDEGAAFIEARADFLLCDFLSCTDPDSLEQLLPPDFIKSEEPLATLPLLQIQASFFRSQGVAIAVCVSHKICDAASLATFVRGWTTTAKGYANAVLPEFTASTIFPPADIAVQLPSLNELYDDIEMCVTKRFVFDPFKIVELKREAASEGVQDPTRVEVVTALIWKCAKKASHTNASSSRPSVMTCGVDLRRRIPSTHLSQNAMGNLLSSFLVKEKPEMEMEIRDIIKDVRKAKDQVNEMIKENLHGNKITPSFGEKMANAQMHLWSELNPETDIFPVTSWCRMPFYEADFGWGSPLWVAPGPNTQSKNTVYMILMDTKDGEGVEAWVALPKQQMFAFEHDKELIAFAISSSMVMI